jgi:hypothetical protein
MVETFLPQEPLMSTIKAVELLTSLVTAVEPPEGVVILLRRRDPTEGVESNWDAAASETLPLATLSLFNTEIGRLTEEHPLVEWGDETSVSLKISDNKA